MSMLRDRIERKLHERFEQIRAETPDKLPDNLFNPVFEHLDPLIDVVAGLRDYSTEPYMEKVRATVCTECLAQPDGKCVRRAADACGLDRYFPTIVAVIEQELRHDPGL